MLVTQIKPAQVLIEIENAFTHISSAKVDSSLASDNYKKAKGHLMRASLDCAKMLWTEQSSIVRNFSTDEDLKRYCINCSEAEFVKLITKANSLAIEARRHEIQFVGIAPLESINKYYAAARAMNEALTVCDFEKLATFKKFRLAYWLKHHAVSLIIGIVAGGIAGSLFS